MKKFLVVNDKGEYYADFTLAPIGRRLITPVFVDVARTTEDSIQVMMVLENGLETLEADFKRLGINYTLIPV